MPAPRQLAAILFTDIQGFTAKMQEDEPAAIMLKDRHREVLEMEHQQFNGRIIQYYGDGTVSIFPSVVNAVQCALNMQSQFCKPPIVPVRMGLHMGDIMESEGDIFGDGVNLASRIESLGVAGSVLLSDKAADELHNHPRFRLMSMGRYQLKNISREVEVFALDHEDIFIPVPGTLTGKTADPARNGYTPQQPAPHTNGSGAVMPAPGKSIAVLPFVNMSNDPDQEYFSDGIAEEILNSITSLQDLRIAGRTSSFQFKGKNMDLRTIGAQLGVSTVLEGSVRRQGKRLRITAQLIDVENGFHLWSERYDSTLDDIFAIQDEIALAITEKLKLTLLDNERDQIKRSYTPDRVAYELYLKGRFYINRRGAAIVQGVTFLQKAVALDPGFALAYSGLADATLLVAFYGLAPPISVMEKAKVAAETAIRLDPTLCEPYCSLGFYYTCCAWDWEKAEENFRKSIQLNPRHPQAHFWYGLLLLAWVKGDFQAARDMGLKGLQLDPLSAIAHANYGGILHAAGCYEQGLAVCEEGLNLDPASFLCLIYKGNALISLKRFTEATTIYEQALNMSNRHPFALYALIILRCLKGDTEIAAGLMDELKNKIEKEYVSSTLAAVCAAKLNNWDESFKFLETALEQKDSFLLTLKYERWFPEGMRADPRFVSMLGKIGFPA